MLDMEAKELMIGDWVVYNGDVEYTDPIKIEGMDIATDMLITSDREDVGFKGVEPIPLTAEILEKNGFKRSQFFAELIYSHFHLLSDCKALCIRCEKSGESLTIDCEYVHELQHALRICGIDKEIKL